MFKNRTLSGRARGAIAGSALALGVATGGFWVSDSPAPVQTDASDCQTVFAGRAGTFNTCNRPADDLVAKNIKKAVGTTGTGCVLGWWTGGPAGIVPGCVGGLVSNIPWGGWD